MLSIPELHPAEKAFPTGVSTPPWEDVPDAFKVHQARTPWHGLADRLFYGQPPATQWHGVPHEGVDAQKAWEAVCETLGNYGIKHQRKIASAAWMLSEWFSDFWWDGDTHTAIDNLDLNEEMEDEA